MVSSHSPHQCTYLGQLECRPHVQAIHAITNSHSDTRARGSLSRGERLDYIDAVHCMRQKLPILPIEQYPGVRHRMDDFTAYASNQN
jgi:hypothetical protein